MLLSRTQVLVSPKWKLAQVMALIQPHPLVEDSTNKRKYNLEAYGREIPSTINR